MSLYIVMGRTFLDYKHSYKSKTEVMKIKMMRSVYFTLSLKSERESNTKKQTKKIIQN